MDIDLERRVLRELDRPRRARLRLAQLAFTAELHSDDLRALAWTRWFLRPFFSQIEGQGSWRVVLVRSNPLWRGMREAVCAAPCREVWPYVQHTHERPPSPELALCSLRVLYDREFDTCCAVSVAHRQAMIVSTRSNDRAPVALMRAVRELASVDHQRNAGLVLHAAAFETGGEATVAVAPKFGGKTTLLIRALLHGAGMIANDRVVLLNSSDEVFVVGMPTIMPVRETTFKLFPAVQTELERQNLHYKRLTGTGPAPRKRAISPVQLCAITGAAVVTRAPLKRVLFLVNGAGFPTRLNSRHASRLLSESLFDFTDWRRLFYASLEPLNPEDFSAAARRAFGRVSEQVECWKYPREWAGESANRSPTAPLATRVNLADLTVPGSPRQVSR